MKKARFISIILCVTINCAYIGYSQVTSKEMTFALRVESTEPGSKHIRFTSAYAYQTPADTQPFVLGEQETPFEAKVSGTQFLGMFKSVSGNTQLKVSLSVFRNGVKCADAQGTGTLNILHADPSGVGYGWPSTIGNISIVQDFLDSHNSHQK